jgi:hypothetical protein
VKPNRGWKRSFDGPIPLPRGRQLVTIEDAGKYITKLPKAEHEAKEWQAAMEALIMVATHGGPTMRTARQLPDQSTTIWVESSSTRALSA